MNVRDLDAAAVRGFVESNRRFFAGRVLEHGPGEPRFKDLVVASAGRHVHSGILPSDETFQAVVCVSSANRADQPQGFVQAAARSLKDRGHLVMTYNCGWTDDRGFKHLIPMSQMQTLVERSIVPLRIVAHNPIYILRTGDPDFTLTITAGIVAQRV